jgi:hypothetical protein
MLFGSLCAILDSNLEPSLHSLACGSKQKLSIGLNVTKNKGSYISNGYSTHQQAQLRLTEARKCTAVEYFTIYRGSPISAITV